MRENNAALMIQRGWKGFYARKFVIPIKISLKHSRLLATALGWRTRKIMKLNATLKKISYIQDHEDPNYLKMMNPRERRESRRK